ncbi:MAG TPA: hypothetical protein VFK94_02300 [Patescibacteria group bacterium]|nr:hypothetical protein [Patescibacteria group bacterium]
MAKLSSEQHDFINFLEQYWYENGALPTKEYCNEIGLASGSTLDNLWDSFSVPDFRDAVLSRGISLRGLEFSPNDPKGRVLTEEQLAVANTMLDLRDNRSQKKKLMDLGIPTQKWEAWLRDPAFQHYLRQRAENALGDNQHEAHLALVDRVRSGDISAIKYFNELTGRYVPQRSNNVDISLVLMRVIEAVQRHVTDPMVQEKIAQELMGLAVAAQVESSGNSSPVGNRVLPLSSSAPITSINGVVA